MKPDTKNVTENKARTGPVYFLWTLIAVGCLLYGFIGFFGGSRTAPDGDQEGAQVFRPASNLPISEITPDRQASTEMMGSDAETEDQDSPEDQFDPEKLDWNIAVSRSQLRQQQRQKMLDVDDIKADSGSEEATAGDTAEQSDEESERLYQAKAEVLLMKLKNGLDALVRADLSSYGSRSGFPTSPLDEHTRMNTLRALNKQKKAIALMVSELPASPESYQSIQDKLDELHELYEKFFSFVRSRTRSDPWSEREKEELVSDSMALYEQIFSLLADKRK